MTAASPTMLGRVCRECDATTGLVMVTPGPFDTVREYECTDRARCQQQMVARFNAANTVGTPVRYWTGVREGDGKTSVTRTPAQLLSGHTAVVWVEGEASCIALSHVAVTR